MKALLLDPYHSGSHQQFSLAWQAQSQHTLRVLSLPGRHFKWRIRSAAVSFAAALRDWDEDLAEVDLLWTTSMCNAAELRGLLPIPLRTKPLVVYFHENQLVYPVRKSDQRDVHFALTNWVSALAADEVWFNSSFNKESFLAGMHSWLQKMPDQRSLGSLQEIEDKSRVEALGITPLSPPQFQSGPLHIAWVGRWEHDKNPGEFFAALDRLVELGCDFKLSCLGQQFNSAPAVFAQAAERHATRLDVFGFQTERSAYERALRAADVVVSTASHEFFGVALLEAVSAGCIPVVPNRLVYPEIYPATTLYEGGAEALADKLMHLAKLKQKEGTLEGEAARLDLAQLVQRYDWSRRAPELDSSLLRVLQRAPNASH